MTLQDFMEQDRAEYYSMSDAFYNTGAVLHPVDSANFEETFNACLAKNPYLRGFMVKENDVNAGFLLLSLSWSNEVGGMCVYLEELYLKDEFRSLGLGSECFRQVEEMYGESARRFRLEVSESNTRAIDLYKRLGYKPLDYLQMTKEK